MIRSMLILLLLTGCATTYEGRDMSGVDHKVHVLQDDAFISRLGMVYGFRAAKQARTMTGEVNGFVYWRGGVCNIVLRQRPFPEQMACSLQHEQDHCLHGAWHGNKPNDSCGIKEE